MSFAVPDAPASWSVQADSAGRPRLAGAWGLALALHLLPLFLLFHRPPVKQVSPPRVMASLWLAPAAAETSPPPPAASQPSPVSQPARASLPLLSRQREPAVASEYLVTPAAQAQVTGSSAERTPAPPRDAAPVSPGDAGDFVPPAFKAAYLSNPQPPYPLHSRRLREAGEVRLRVQVSASGLAEQVVIHAGSGYERLDLAARAAVREWRFVPARRDGNAVSGWVEVPIQFKLEN